MIRVYKCGRCGKIVRYDDSIVGNYNESQCSCGGYFSEQNGSLMIRTYKCGRCGKIVQFADGSCNYNESQCSCGGYFSEQG